jgi:hypothetical protein
MLSGCGSTVVQLSGQPATGSELNGASRATSSSGGSGARPMSPGGEGLGTTVGGSGSNSQVGGSGAPNAAPIGANTGGAVASARGALKIGVLYLNNATANSELGVSTSASSDPKSIMNALVAAENRRGGLAGRRVVVDYFTFDSTSSDYSTQASAACAHFTQDAPVPVVLDLALGNTFGMASCLAKRGVADFGIGTEDSVADNAVGLFAAPDWMTSSRRYPAVLNGLHETGYLTPQNKIGVLLEDCPGLERAESQAVMPTISRLGLHLVDTEHINCTTGFSSAGPAASDVQSAVLHFRSNGVDRVLMVSNFEQVTLLLMANAAESQSWRPGFMLSSNAETEVMRANIPSGQWPQLHGIGWSPGLDIDDPHQPLPQPDQHCLDLIKQGGGAVSGWQNTYISTTECSALFLFASALRGSGGDARGTALMSAVEALGSSFVAPGIVGGRTSFTPDRRDGPAAVAPFAYAASCSCLKYVGRARSVS